ncbi:NADPH-dependent FMN reductase [Rhodobacter lacus]|uniref:NADPH-dependent FMN reductase n=1 Tax=Rhodobacter lacus TaxID=1641972 RepID=A0ABW5ABX9_9RHOB
MKDTFEIAVFVGSLRTGSLTRKLAEALADLAPASLRFKFIEIGDLPFYNPDLDTDTPPASWARLRTDIAAADGVLFVTPEYNRSIPAALKNAIDIASRPYGQSAWNGKPAAVVSGSGGALAGFGANHHLRQMLVVLDMPTMAQPEAYIGHLGDLFDAAGKVKSEDTRAFLRQIATSFAAWVARHAA